MKRKAQESAGQPADCNAVLTPMKEEEEGRMGGKSLRLQCSAEKVLTVDSESPESKLPVKGMPHPQEWLALLYPPSVGSSPRAL